MQNSQKLFERNMERRIVQHSLKTKKCGPLTAAALRALTASDAKQNGSEDTVHLPNIPLKYKSRAKGEWFALRALKK